MAQLIQINLNKILVGTPFESVIFFFDPTELPIITIYALYIPIFINWMKKATDESALRAAVEAEDYTYLGPEK